MAKSFTDYVQTVIVKKGLTGLFQCPARVRVSSSLLYMLYKRERNYGLAAMMATEEWSALLAAGHLLHVLTNLVFYATWS